MSNSFLKVRALIKYGEQLVVFLGLFIRPHFRKKFTTSRLRVCPVKVWEEVRGEKNREHFGPNGLNLLHFIEWLRQARRHKTNRGSNAGRKRETP